MSIVRPADILLPKVKDMTAWSVVACDQFTSQREYWDAAEQRVGEAPSTLRLMLPEAWLGTPEADGAEARIAAAMESYLERGVFTEELPCKHPVGAVGEPFDIVKREIIIRDGV